MFQTFDLNQTSLTVKCSTEVLPDDFSDSHTDCGTVHKLLSNDPKVYYRPLCSRSLYIFSDSQVINFALSSRVQTTTTATFVTIMWTRRHFPGGGISRKIKKFPPVYGHLNALQLSISVHQRCSVTFKLHQIHSRPGLRPIRTLGSSPHSLVSSAGTSSKEGRQDEHLPRAPQTLAPPLSPPCHATS